MSREEFLKEKEKLDGKLKKTIEVNHSAEFRKKLSRRGLSEKADAIISKLDSDAHWEHMVSTRELADRYVSGLPENSEIDSQVNGILALSMNYCLQSPCEVFYKDKFLTLV